MRRIPRRTLTWLLAAAMVTVFVLTVWPTAYRYGTAQDQQSWRQHRLTGNVEVLFPRAGWIPVGEQRTLFQWDKVRASVAGATKSLFAPKPQEAPQEVLRLIPPPILETPMSSIPRQLNHNTQLTQIGYDGEHHTYAYRTWGDRVAHIVAAARVMRRVREEACAKPHNSRWRITKHHIYGAAGDDPIEFLFDVSTCGDDERVDDAVYPDNNEGAESSVRQRLRRLSRQ